MQYERITAFFFFISVDQLMLTRTISSEITHFTGVDEEFLKSGEVYTLITFDANWVDGKRRRDKSL